MTRRDYGNGEFFDPEFVANSGYHAAANGVWIEDLPASRGLGIAELIPGLGDTQTFRDLVGDFGETHSITPLIDSLTVLDLLQSLDPNLGMETYTQVMKAMANSTNEIFGGFAGKVGELLSQAPALDTASALLKAMLNDNIYDADALENMVNALSRLFLGDDHDPGLTPDTSVANGYANLDKRNALHDAIKSIQNTVAYQLATQFAGVGGGIVSLAALSRDALASKAGQDDAEGMAYRYALKQLNPFAVVGEATLYDGHNADGELDLYDPATGEGNLSELYLQDRAAMLAWKLNFDSGKRDSDDLWTLGDKPYSEDWDAWWLGKVQGDWKFIDNGKTVNGQPLELNIDGLMGEAHTIAFGKDHDADLLAGGDNADHLYSGGGDDIIQGNGGNDHLEGGLGLDELQGGAGNDTLIGGAGADYLTGGKDSDTLQGGLGNDTYIFSSGDGWDWIDDADGQGVIKYDNTPLTGGKKVADNIWQSADRHYTYSLYDRTENGQAFKVLSIQGPSGGMWVKHWQDGQLGITLEDAPATTPPAPAAVPGVVKKTSYYDQDHTVIDARGQGPLEITAVGDQGEVWGSGVLKGNEFANYLHNGEGDDQLYGEGGRDVLIATTGNDRLYGGLGDDALSGGVDNDAYYNNTAQLLRRAA